VSDPAFVSDDIGSCLTSAPRFLENETHLARTRLISVIRVVIDIRTSLHGNQEPFSERALTDIVLNGG